MREPQYSILADIQDAIERAKQWKLALYWQRTIQREYRCKKVTLAEQQAYEQLQSILSEISQWNDEEDLRSDMEEAAVLLGATYGLAGACTGPLLGAVLTVAAVGGSPAYGAVLLAFFALGMVVPLLVLAVAWERLRLGERARPRRLAIIDADLAIVFINDFLDNGQPQSRATRLGGDVWLENSRHYLRRKAGSAITDR